MTEFTLDEAVSLIYRIVVMKADKPKQTRKPAITEMGHICGVLTLNEQIEVVIKFHDGLKQFSKEEMITNVYILDE